MATWIDLLDPSEQSLRDCLPESIHHEALERLMTSARQGTSRGPGSKGKATTSSESS